MRFGFVLKLMLCGLLLLGFVSQVQATEIRPVSGSTLDPIAYSTSIDNIIDGIIDYDSYLALGNSGYGTFGGPYTVRFDLGAEYDLTDFNLWNNAGDIENDGEGVNSFSLKFNDPFNYIFNASASDTLTKQSFNFIGETIKNVRFIDFIINSSHSVGTSGTDGRNTDERGYVDFYEVSFEGARSTVPEPATILLLGFGLLSLAGVSRQKN